VSLTVGGKNSYEFNMLIYLLKNGIFSCFWMTKDQKNILTVSDETGKKNEQFWKSGIDSFFPPTVNLTQKFQQTKLQFSMYLIIRVGS